MSTRLAVLPYQRNMRGKREFVATVSNSIGLTNILEFLPQKNILLILNYHRIGSAAETPYDPNVFSATAEEFSRHIALFKRRFHIATLEEALSIAQGAPCRGTVLLITFDDGYIDCYTQAYPILRSHGIPATFFLPTAFVGTGQLPWWDKIAYIVKKSRHPRFRLAYPHIAEFDLERDGPVETSRRVLEFFRQPAASDTPHFMSELQDACGVAAPSGDTERCFLSWDEAREMQAHGMTFGSHTHRHEILSKISISDQEEEIRISRRILEKEMHVTIDTLAYPVGLRNCFSPDTHSVLEKAGYRAAFSYYGGINHPGDTRLFDIKRFGVGDQSYTRLSLQTALASSTGSYWI
jgi:peptidoglycan/xylan/chitin deacetylase (PgdA/CDA1 family)